MGADIPPRPSHSPRFAHSDLSEAHKKATFGRFKQAEVSKESFTSEDVQKGATEICTQRMEVVRGVNDLPYKSVTIKYEDIAINPKEEIDKLFASLGMSVSQDVYYYILSSSKSKDSSSHGFDVIKNSKDVYDRWTREMDPAMMAIVTEQLAGKRASSSFHTAQVFANCKIKSNLNLISRFLTFCFITTPFSHRFFSELCGKISIPSTQQAYDKAIWSRNCSVIALANAASPPRHAHRDKAALCKKRKPKKITLSERCTRVSGRAESPKVHIHLPKLLEQLHQI
eukprot:sb/3467799/